ncbi:MAG: hypothetical protein A3K19_10075 [Lentisphaerae bacterium RIFOXYB12_FULL_65_16]|nr:MAG: hypothetical protein A3K18_27765 [Lentisphaerae bacterium RIFOXYA12_64_32]OGV91294.1 MAG: hypothetical protein A3K19_10075 [Lentisphaerae bacterium RIFOXYB12_FULL_65_16]
MATPEHLSASQEDYLEAILLISSRKRAARATDIARHLHVKGPSVTGALRSLARQELVNYAPYDLITLTEKGERLATEVCRRHEALERFFLHVLHVSDAAAAAAACRIEHAIPTEVLERLMRLAEFAGACPRLGQDWLARAESGCQKARDGRRCAQCLTEDVTALAAAAAQQATQRRTGADQGKSNSIPRHRGRQDVPTHHE